MRVNQGKFQMIQLQKEVGKLREVLDITQVERGGHRLQLNSKYKKVAERRTFQVNIYAIWSVYLQRYLADSIILYIFQELIFLQWYLADSIILYIYSRSWYTYSGIQLTLLSYIYILGVGIPTAVSSCLYIYILGVGILTAVSS